MSDRYYGTVKEVKEVFTAEAANEFLKQGWELLRIADVQRDEVARLASGGEEVARVTVLVYLMGREERRT